MSVNVMTKDEYEKNMAELHAYLLSEGGNFKRTWAAAMGHKRWLLDDHWLTIVRELPPLMAAAQEYGEPKGEGRWAWSVVAPVVCEQIFSTDHDRFVAQMREFMTTDFTSLYFDEERRCRAMEEYIIAYRHFSAFAKSMKRAGVTQYRLEFTERGMSERELKALEEFIGETGKRIELIRNPPPKAPLFGR